MPDVMEVLRSKEDKFVLLACDGVWEKYVSSNQKMVEHLSTLMTSFNDAEVMENLLDGLVAQSGREVLGCDNMSGILLEL
jgi:serine/threonine protein phosphatase PrpC